MEYVIQEGRKKAENKQNKKARKLKLWVHDLE